MKVNGARVNPYALLELPFFSNPARPAVLVEPVSATSIETGTPRGTDQR